MHRASAVAIGTGMTERVCAVDGCERTQTSESTRLKRGMCPGHYQRQLLHGDAKSTVPFGHGRLRNGYTQAESKKARKYGMTIQELQQFLAPGKCEICGTTEPGGNGTFSIDHDHSCCDFKADGSHTTCGNCNRGLLCYACNTALGYMRDNPERLRLAANYLEKKKP